MDLTRLTYEQQARIRTKVFINMSNCNVFNPHKQRYMRMYQRLINLTQWGQ